MTRATTMTSDQIALLRAVIAAPDDDLPRLVYADWLEEHGQPERAECIRLLVEMSVLEAASEDFQALKVSAEYRGLMLQVQVLWLTHGRRWAAEIAPGFLRERSRPPWFPRGFIEDAYLPAGIYLRELDRIHARTPLRKVYLTHPTDRPPVDLRPLAAHPGFRSVEYLGVTGPVSPAGFAALAASPHAMRLGRVSVRGETVSAGWVGTALGGPWAGVVRGLELWNEGGFPDRERLGASAVRPAAKLEDLALRRVHLDPAEVADLVAVLPSLESLDLDFIEGGEASDVLWHLAGAPAPAGLKSLSLSCNEVTAAGAERLADAGWLGHLRRLALDYNRVGDDGVVALASTPRIGGLSYLSLDNNQITERGARALADSPHLGSCVHLSLFANPLTREGVGLLRERFGGRVETS